MEHSGRRLRRRPPCFHSGSRRSLILLRLHSFFPFLLVILAVTFVITHLGSPERPCSSAWSVRGGQDPVELTFKCKNHCKEQGKDCPGASSCKLSGTGICRMTVRVPSQICATGQILRTCISVETENPCALTLENPCDEEFIVCHQQVAVCGQVFECEG